MALKVIDKDWKSGRKEVKYLSKDFVDFRNNLIEFAKVYFPDTYNDFNETSPGMMFIEMASAMGDVLSYYIDDTLKESLLYYAQERQNVMQLSQFLGYRPKPSTAALTKFDVFQLVPSTGTGINNAPDYRFAVRIREGMEVGSETSPEITFRTSATIDFGFSSSLDPTEVSVYERDSLTGEPTYYLLKKQVDAFAGRLKEIEVDFGTPQKFSRVRLSDTNIIDIYDVRDLDNNKWYEVPYLAQDTVFIDHENTEEQDSAYTEFRATVPYLIRLLKTPRRFVSRVMSDNTVEIHFGAGVSDSPDEIIIPNPKNVGSGLPNSPYTLDQAFDPANFLRTQTYGQAPANTTLTVKYVVGGGLSSNVPQGDLISISRIDFGSDNSSLNDEERKLLRNLKNSIAVINPIAATGGKDVESIEEIRENALANFASQNRAVTRKDYVVRTMSMPPKYGGVAKAYVAADGELDLNDPLNAEFNKAGTFEKNNPFAVNLYVLGYNAEKHLVTLNKAVKRNLKTFLGEYRMLTDGVNILDGYIINIGVNFEIAVYGTFNKREVVLNAIEALKDMFDIDRWQFNQPIIISDIELTIANVEGVRSVINVEIVNKCGGQYSPHGYNILQATKDKIVYPSLDPSVFEVKFPNTDLRGRVL